MKCKCGNDMEGGMGSLGITYSCRKCGRRMIDDDEYKWWAGEPHNLAKPNAQPALCDVSAGRFISDHFELLKATINASELWDYDTIVKFRRVCTECGISCEVIDGVLR